MRSLFPRTHQHTRRVQLQRAAAGKMHRDKTYLRLSSRRAHKVMGLCSRRRLAKKRYKLCARVCSYLYIIASLLKPSHGVAGENKNVTRSVERRFKCLRATLSKRHTHAYVYKCYSIAHYFYCTKAGLKRYSRAG